MLTTPFNKSCFLLLMSLISFGATAQRAFSSLRGHTLQGPAIGALAPDFTLADAQGKPVSLQDFRGHYVLIDFWASWCGPCRHQNPLLVAAFEQYKNHNFTILGVTSPRLSHPEFNRVAWLQAIQADGLSWPQVVGDSTLNRRYAVEYIPQNVLVDPNGRVIARNIEGKHLQRKLAKLLPAMTP